MKLLRVLQERTFERVGESQHAAHGRPHRRGHERRPASARSPRAASARTSTTACASCRSRSRRCASGARTSSRSPHFLLARVGARQGRALRFSPDALRLLLEHPWPGNVRELENALEYAVAVCKGQTILPDDLPGEVAAHGPYAPARADDAPAGPARAAPSAAARRAEADAVDAARIRGALEACHWRRHEAAPRPRR